MNARVISYNSFPCIYCIYIKLPDILNMSLQLWNCKVLSWAIEPIFLQKVGIHSGYGSSPNTNGNLHTWTWNRASAEENLTTLVTWFLWKPHSISAQHLQSCFSPSTQNEESASSCLSHPSGSVGGREWWVFIVITKEGTLLCWGGGQKEVKCGSRREVEGGKL